MVNNITMTNLLAIGMLKELHYSNGLSMITGIEIRKVQEVYLSANVYKQLMH